MMDDLYSHANWHGCRLFRLFGQSPERYFEGDEGGLDCDKVFSNPAIGQSLIPVKGAGNFNHAVHRGKANRAPAVIEPRISTHLPKMSSSIDQPQVKSKKAHRFQMFMPESLVPVFLFVVAIPISMLMWIGHLAFSFFKETSRLDSDIAVVPPTRWLASTLIPLALVLHALRRKHVSRSGAALGSIIAFALSLASYSFLACLIAFFFSSSQATKFRQDKKKKIEEHFKEGGQRNWVQVLCNGGMAAQLAFLYILDMGCGERPINFTNDYRGSWLNLGVLGSFACCNGDTWASELGTVVGKAEPYLITSWKKVPRGTNGGVTIWGLIFSAVGGAFIGIFHYLTTFYFVDTQQLETAPPQWPLIVAGALAGLFGSMLDSVLGATLQYSGVDERTGVVVERSGKGIRHISGVRFLDNHCVNLISSITVGLLTPRFANILWPAAN